MTEGSACAIARRKHHGTANLRTKILDFRGFDSSRILIEGEEFPGPGEFPGKFESSNLIGVILVGRLGL